VNAPESTVLSGRLEELAAVEARLTAQGVEVKRLTVSHAFHSPQMDAIADEFARRAAALEFRTPTVAIISSVTGERVTRETLQQADYWRRQVRDAVQFQAAMTTLAASGYDTFVEVGPAATLTGLGQQCLTLDGLTWATSFRRERPEKALGATHQILSALGRLYARGVEIDFAAFDAPFGRARVPLPTYPFQRQRYWLDQAPRFTTTAAAPKRLSGHAMLHGRVPAAVPIFEAHLSTEAFPFIDDHRVAGTAVLPGSVYTELALAAAGEAFGQSDASLALQHPSRYAVQGLVLREPLRLDAAGHRVQVVLTPTGAEQATVQILSQPAGNPAAAWTTHAQAAIGRAPTSAPATPDLAALRQGVTGTFATTEFYDALRTHGIELGARCRGIHALWADDRQVLAEVRLDPSLASEVGAYRMHPALLDSCLQVFGALLLRTGQGGQARVLTRVGQFTLFGAPSATVWCHATIDPATGAGRVVVLDESGTLVAEAAGLETTAVGGDHADGSRPQPVDDWFYEVAWTPAETTAAVGAGEVLADGALATRLQAEADRRFEEQGLERYHQAHDDVSALASTYIGDALRTIAAELAPGSRFTTASLAESAKVVDRHRSLFGRLLDILGEDGHLRQTGDGWELVSLPSGDADAMVNSLLTRFPAFAADLTLTARCATQLGPVLQGTADPLHLLFPGGNTQELEGLYTDSPSAQAFNPLVRQAVLDAIAAAPAGRKVRILEIGAGTGGTTGFVVPALPADRVEYTFTDVSPLFLARASERFEQYPFMRYEVLDIEAPATPPERYDIVVAANVLHATADMRSTMTHVRERLAPGGLLVLLEGTSAERWVDLTFGMTDGWWRFTDRDLRPRYALLDTPTWRTLLGEMGFGRVEAVAPRQGTQQVVLLAQAPQAAPGRWLVVGDGVALAPALELELQKHGAESVRVAPSEVASKIAGAAGVVFLGGLAVHAGIEADAIAEGTVAATEALEVMRAVAAAGGAKLWMVTSGAQPAGGTPTSAMQAPLWGLGRTFALEHPDAWGGLLDVDPTATEDANAAALWAAVRGADDEDQLALRDGATLAPRIERRAAPNAAAPTFSATGKYLVTGGLGNIGLRIAEWLVANGARHVVLNGRTGLPDRATWDTLAADAPAYRRVQAVRKLEAQGATVTVLTADLSRPEAADVLRAAFAPGELRGVLHAAAVFDANPIERATADELRRVLDTKTVGATVVSDLARAAKADFVVLFSSTTSLLGVRGMAAYAAANQALDSLAHALRRDGVPALSVDWGTWDELGDLSEEVRQSYVRAGLLPMPAGQALEALGRAIAAGETQLTIAQIDWSALKTIYQARRRRPILAHVTNREAPVVQRVEQAVAQSAAPADVLTEIAALPEAERSRRLLEIVRTTAASVLALQPEEVDPQLGLFEMGMDSLMSVELRSRLERAVGRKLPSTLTFNYPNVRALAGYLAGLVTPKPTAPAAPATPATPTPPAPAATLADVDSDAMSEDEIAAMLSDALQSID
jgi:acyl transferase domain-containing protein/acyl carrier protein